MSELIDRHIDDIGMVGVDGSGLDVEFDPIYQLREELVGATIADLDGELKVQAARFGARVFNALLDLGEEVPAYIGDPKKPENQAHYTLLLEVMDRAREGMPEVERGTVTFRGIRVFNLVAEMTQYNQGNERSE